MKHLKKFWVWGLKFKCVLAFFIGNQMAKKKKTILTFLMLLTLGWSVYKTIMDISLEFDIDFPILLGLIAIIYLVWKEEE